MVLSSGDAVDELVDGVDAGAGDRARVGVLEGGCGAHQRGLAGTVGAEQTKHLVADGEGEISESFGAIGVGLGKT